MGPRDILKPYVTFDPRGIMHNRQCLGLCLNVGAVQPVGMLMDLVASNTVLEEAYAWLCRRRRDYPANCDVWAFRHKWPDKKQRIASNLRADRCRFDALHRVTRRDGSCVYVWTSRDALVLKALSLCFARVLPASRRCTHLKRHGGAKVAIRQVAAHLPMNSYVLRTDFKSYYASIDHHLLLDRLAAHVRDRKVMNLL